MYNSDMPEGFKKSVGPRGSFLSGGQKQRLSITRALIRKPKIIIFD
jgi:ABC-type multidrug transport system fused ATPase/permease subunit